MLIWFTVWIYQLHFILVQDIIAVLAVFLHLIHYETFKSLLIRLVASIERILKSRSRKSYNLLTLHVGTMSCKNRGKSIFRIFYIASFKIIVSMILGLSESLKLADTLECTKLGKLYLLIQAGTQVIFSNVGLVQPWTYTSLSFLKLTLVSFKQWSLDYHILSQFHLIIVVLLR